MSPPTICSTAGTVTETPSRWDSIPRSSSVDLEKGTMQRQSSRLSHQHASRAHDRKQPFSTFHA